MIYAGITCRGKPEEDTLATSCLSIVYWLFQCYHYALTKAPQSNLLAPQPVELMDKPAYLLKELLSSDFICAMLHTAKHDNKGKTKEMTNLFFFFFSFELLFSIKSV